MVTAFAILAMFVSPKERSEHFWSNWSLGVIQLWKLLLQWNVFQSLAVLTKLAFSAFSRFFFTTFCDRLWRHWAFEFDHRRGCTSQHQRVAFPPVVHAVWYRALVCTSLGVVGIVGAVGAVEKLGQSFSINPTATLPHPPSFKINPGAKHPDPCSKDDMGDEERTLEHLSICAN